MENSAWQNGSDTAEALCQGSGLWRPSKVRRAEWGKGLLPYSKHGRTLTNRMNASAEERKEVTWGEVEQAWIRVWRVKPSKHASLQRRLSLPFSLKQEATDMVGCVYGSCKESPRPHILCMRIPRVWLRWSAGLRRVPRLHTSDQCPGHAHNAACLPTTPTNDAR